MQIYAYLSYKQYVRQFFLSRRRSGTVLGVRPPAGKAGVTPMHRILIVSEEEFLCDVIRLSLTGMRADVRCASGVAAMERLSRRMLFDLVIVVGTSLFFSGRDVVRILRPPGLRRPLVYVVAWQQAEQPVLSLLECGVDQYLTFPVNLQRLRAKVDNELNRQL